jgi:diguanylate cyclase (GGDEF)-like protein
VIPPTWGDETPFTTRNTYVLSWVILGIVLPLVLAAGLLIPPLRPVLLATGATFGAIAILQIVVVRTGGRAEWAAPALIVGGWTCLTWTAWLTGGLHSPMLYAQFVLVVLAELCNGWRWGATTLAFSLATVGIFAFAQAGALVPRSSTHYDPYLFAFTIAMFLVALFLLESMLASTMRASHKRLGVELAIRRSLSRRLRELVDNAPFGAFVCELDDSQDLRIAQTNRAVTTILRTHAPVFLGQTVEQAFPTLLGTPLVAELRSIAEEGGQFDGTEEFERDDGRVLSLELHCFRMAHRTLAVFFADVTEKRKAEAAIRHAAYHDDLTSLPNRKLLVDRLKTAFAGARRREMNVGLLFIDVDDFKLINDELGHSIGDELLTEAARRLVRNSRVSDTVARFGGDEFTILLPDIADVEHAEKVAQKLVEAFREPFEIGGRHVTTTVSIGVGITHDDDQDPEALLGRADMAMYQMKRAGRDGYRVFSPSPGNAHLPRPATPALATQRVPAE